MKHALKMTATSGFLSALDCTKFAFGQGFAPDSAGGAYSAPPGPLASLRRTLLLKERGGEGKEWKGGEKREGRGECPPQPLWQIPGSAPGLVENLCQLSPAMQENPQKNQLILALTGNQWLLKCSQ